MFAGDYQNQGMYDEHQTFLGLLIDPNITLAAFLSTLLGIPGAKHINGGHVLRLDHAAILIRSRANGFRGE